MDVFLKTFEASEYQRLKKEVDEIKKREGATSNFERLEIALAEYAEINEKKIWLLDKSP